MNAIEVGALEPAVLSYKWEIDNYSVKSDSSCRLSSPVFSTKQLDNPMEWLLCLYPKGSKEEHQDYLSIFVHILGENEITAEITFSVLNIENKNVFKQVMKNNLFATGSKSWGFPRFVKRSFISDEKNRVLENDTLKVLCEINFHPSITDVEEQFTLNDGNDIEEKYEKPNCRLKEFDDFEKLLESEAFSDITFVVEEKKIYAHKAILVTRSPVFAVMFQRYPTEQQDKTFEITGTKYEAMKELLRFLYTGRVNDIEQQAADLLILADKYSVTGLKALCEKTLNENLNTDNAIEYLHLAATCDAALLKSEAVEFIANNLEGVTENPKFEQFGELDSKLICEVVRAISKKISK